MKVISEPNTVGNQKKTIFQNIGVHHIEEESLTESTENEEVRKHLEKMGKELKLENEMEVI